MRHPISCVLATLLSLAWGVAWAGPCPLVETVPGVKVPAKSCTPQEAAAAKAREAKPEPESPPAFRIGDTDVRLGGRGGVGLQIRR